MWPRARYSLRDKIVVISGGSRGLGLALAREFAKHGAHIALLARDKEELERAEADLLRFNAPVSTWPCDVKEPREAEHAISAIAEKHARIDVLVNNAGVMLVAPLNAMVKSDFEEAMELHFWAPYHLTMAALPSATKHRKPDREHLFHRRPSCSPSYGALLRKQVCLSGFFRCASRRSRWARSASDNCFSWPDAHRFACSRYLSASSYY